MSSSTPSRSSSYLFLDAEDTLRSPGELAEASSNTVTQPYDAISIASEDSQWLFVDAEEQSDLEKVKAPHEEQGENQGADLFEEQSDLEKVTAPDEEQGESQGADFLEEHSDLEDVELVDVDQAQRDDTNLSEASATLLATELLLPGNDSVTECKGHRMDVTECWFEALKGFPRVTNAFCLGRIMVQSATRTQCINLSASMRFAVRNDGLATWPAATALHIVAGNAYGCDVLEIGQIEKGHGADMLLGLNLHADGGSIEKGSGKRSAWVLVDSGGEPFGPLIVLEVIWV